MDAAERRRMQNREAQRRFRRGKPQQRALPTPKAQKKPGNSSGCRSRRGQSSINNGCQSPSQKSLLRLDSDHDYSTTILDDLDRLHGAVMAAMPIPPSSDVCVEDPDYMPSSATCVDDTTQWLSAFSAPDDAFQQHEDDASNLKWHEIERLAHLQPSSGNACDDLVLLPLTPPPCYQTPPRAPESPARNGWPRDTVNACRSGSDSQASEIGSRNNRGNEPEAFQTTLHIAAGGGHDAMIDMVLAKGGLAVDERDSDANTALHVAVASQKSSVVLRLLSHGADPNSENAAGWTPLHIAVQMGSVEVVGALVSHGGDLGKKARGRNPELGPTQVSDAARASSRSASL